MFTEKIKKRFKNPKNVGDLKKFNALGSANGKDCSDCVVIKLDIKNDKIQNAKFQVCGCPGVICTADVFIDLIKGASTKEACLVNEKDIAKALGVFPKEYLHCAKLPLLAFKKAVKNYNSKIIGITGGKGGTGKSTIATAIVFELAKNNKVLLVDADVDCPNDHLLLNIERKLYRQVEQRIPKWDFKKCAKCGLCGIVCKTKAIVSIKGKNPIFTKQQCNGCGACILKCPNDAISWDKKEIGKIYTGSKYGIDLLSGELKTNEPVSEFVVNSLNKIIEQKKDKYDYIVIDTAAGTHCPVIAALEICDTVFAVTEPTPLGVHDLELILQLLKIIKVESSIISNRSDIGDKKLIEEIGKKYETKVVAEIPYSKDIVSKYVKGEPIKNKNINIITNEFIK